jgi:hypothetical protein
MCAKSNCLNTNVAEHTKIVVTQERHKLQVNMQMRQSRNNIFCQNKTEQKLWYHAFKLLLTNKQRPW